MLADGDRSVVFARRSQTWSGSMLAALSKSAIFLLLIGLDDDSTMLSDIWWRCNEDEDIVEM